MICEDSGVRVARRDVQRCGRWCVFSKVELFVNSSDERSRYEMITHSYLN